MGSKKLVPFTVMLEPEQLNQLIKEGLDKKISIGWIVRKALDLYFNKSTKGEDT